MCGASCRRLRRRTDAKGASSPLGHCGSRRLPHERLAVPAVRIRFARLEHELTTRLFTPAGSSPPSLGLRPHVAARSPMSGASLPATKPPECGRETLIQSCGQCGLSSCPAESSHRSTRFVEFERLALVHIGVPIAHFRRAAPARCGAFADERRVVAAARANECAPAR